MSDLPQLLFLIAAGLAALGVAAHELVGSPIVLGPLKDSGLPVQIIWLHHFSWHTCSVAGAVMVGLFLVAAHEPQQILLAAFAVAMCAGFALLGIGLALFGNKALWRTPAPYPWSLNTLIGGLGLYFS